jgi:hypothetical protein
MWWPARVEDVGVVVVIDGSTEQEGYGVDREEQLAEHGAVWRCQSKAVDMRLKKRHLVMASRGCRR